MYNKVISVIATVNFPIQYVFCHSATVIEPSQNSSSRKHTDASALQVCRVHQIVYQLQAAGDHQIIFQCFSKCLRKRLLMFCRSIREFIFAVQVSSLVPRRRYYFMGPSSAQSRQHPIISCCCYLLQSSSAGRLLQRAENCWLTYLIFSFLLLCVAWPCILNPFVYCE